jgi:MFS family permease
VIRSHATSADESVSVTQRGAMYCFFVLLILLVANVLNFADRAILSVLADPIKRDLHLSNAQIGFLFGTNFVVINSILGIAMGRVIDLWRRNRLVGIGVAVWSAMTALSGLAGNYLQLAAARFGIGIGEATIGPAAYSMLSDIFPPNRRALVFAIYLCAPFIGTALSLALGGWLVQNWSSHCDAVGLCAVKGWQAAFFAFGLPGIIVAVLAALIGDPAEGSAAAQRAAVKPLTEGLRELAVLIPPFMVFRLWTLGGVAAVRANLAAAAIIILAAAGLLWLTGDLLQWGAVAVAVYALFSWSQAQVYLDADLHRLTVASWAFRAMTLAGGVLATLSAAVAFWSVSLATRTLGITPAEAGASLALAISGGSMGGTLLGGYAADRWRRVNRAAPLFLAMLALLGSAPLLGVMLMVRGKWAYACALAGFMAFIQMWASGMAALVQDMVLPAMRGRAAATYNIAVTLIAMSVGPYFVGRIADVTGSIATGMATLYLTAPVTIVVLVLAVRWLPRTLDERARLAARLPTSIQS